MSIAADSPPADSAYRRRQSRIARQARVGILRNTNEPPRPPPRKAALTGRWLSLRSSRRPPQQEVVEAALAVTHPPDGGADPANLPLAALRHDEQGRLAGIDVARLMASVAGLGTAKPIRTPYGADIRPDVPPPSLNPVSGAMPRTRAKPRPDLFEEEVEDDVPPHAPHPPDDQPPVVPRHSRRRSVWPVLGGIALAFVALVLVPALMAL